MAYKTEDLFKTAMEQIKKHNLFFIEDIIAFLPCAKPTFYEHFPNDSDNYKRLFAELERNRTEVKVSMRKDWRYSDSPALQMGLMKLICTDDERNKLSLSRVETNQPTLNLGILNIDPLYLNEGNDRSAKNSGLIQED